MKSIALTLVTAFSLSFITSAQAEEMPHGMSLHNNNCVACHARMTGGDGSTLYTRADRKVTSLPKLAAQVRRCETNLGLTWFDEDVEAVTEYLNATHYQF